MIARHKETGNVLYIIKSRPSYGGVIVYDCVDLEMAQKYNYDIPPHLSGLYFEGSLIIE